MIVLKLANMHPSANEDSDGEDEDESKFILMRSISFLKYIYTCTGVG